MVRLTDHPNMTIAVDWDLKDQTKHLLDGKASVTISQENKEETVFIGIFL